MRKKNVIDSEIGSKEYFFFPKTKEIHDVIWLVQLESIHESLVHGRGSGSTTRNCPVLSFHQSHQARYTQRKNSKTFTVLLNLTYFLDN